MIHFVCMFFVNSFSFLLNVTWFNNFLTKRHNSVGTYTRATRLGIHEVRLLPNRASLRLCNIKMYILAQQPKCTHGRYMYFKVSDCTIFFANLSQCGILDISQGGWISLLSVPYWYQKGQIRNFLWPSKNVRKIILKNTKLVTIRTNLVQFAT